MPKLSKLQTVQTLKFAGIALSIVGTILGNIQQRRETEELVNKVLDERAAKAIAANTVPRV